jgi:uncharacterized membrane protein
VDVRGTERYGRPMEIVVVIVVIVVAVVVLAMSPMTRRTGNAVEHEARQHADVDRQFKRPPNQGDLL